MSDGETGRPTKCTPELTELICAEVALGLPNEDAAVLHGIDESTFYRWQQWGSGEDAREPYATFCKRLREAKAKRKKGQIMAMLHDDPHPVLSRNIQWYLERQDRANFGNTKAVELSGPGGSPIRQEVDVRKQVEEVIRAATDEQLEALAKSSE